MADPAPAVSRRRRSEVLDALRRGTVPQQGLDLLAVGLDRFQSTVEEELGVVEAGGAKFKALRGEYGTGKTFFSRWLMEQAKRRGFAASEVQISETETPLHRLETVYRRLMERLATAEMPGGALTNILDGWFFALEQDVLKEDPSLESDEVGLDERVNLLMEQRLSAVSRTAPVFALALRAYREAQSRGDLASAESLAAWLGGQPNISATVKRSAGIKGEIDHFGALGFLQGLLVVLRDSGRPGLVVVLDEVETVQRMRSDVRDKSLNALRQLMDEVDSGRFPGLYLLITGTAAFYESPQGVQRLQPLAQRLHVDFATEARFDNPRAVQVRLHPFGQERLESVGRRVRDLFASDSPASGRIMELADDAYVAALATAVAGRLGGKTGIAPRIFLKKLVADILDRVEQFDDFRPREHYSLTLEDSELLGNERTAAAAGSVDDIELEL